MSEIFRVAWIKTCGIVLRKTSDGNPTPLLCSLPRSRAAAAGRRLPSTDIRQPERAKKFDFCIFFMTAHSLVFEEAYYCPPTHTHQQQAHQDLNNPPHTHREADWVHLGLQWRLQSATAIKWRRTGTASAVTMEARWETVTCQPLMNVK